jgi:isoaspartyl peptidase/L-asparaginase-like protein (Ntn-hydrolase superfamily)
MSPTVVGAGVYFSSTKENVPTTGVRPVAADVLATVVALAPTVDDEVDKVEESPQAASQSASPSSARASTNRLGLVVALGLSRVLTVSPTPFTSHRRA